MSASLPWGSEAPISSGVAGYQEGTDSGQVSGFGVLKGGWLGVVALAQGSAPQRQLLLLSAPIVPLRGKFPSWPGGSQPPKYVHVLGTGQLARSAKPAGSRQTYFLESFLGDSSFRQASIPGDAFSEKGP